MRSFVIAFLIIFMSYRITNNAMPNFLNKDIKEKNEAYEACNRLRIKAPYLNLKCEKLIETPKNNNKEEKQITGIKLLSTKDVIIRKVNKSQEIKLRNLLEKLTSENILRKD